MTETIQGHKKNKENVNTVHNYYVLVITTSHAVVHMQIDSKSRGNGYAVHNSKMSYNYVIGGCYNILQVTCTNSTNH